MRERLAAADAARDRVECAVRRGDVRARPVRRRRTVQSTSVHLARPARHGPVQLAHQVQQQQAVPLLIVYVHGQKEEKYAFKLTM